MMRKENVQQTCQASLPKKRSISESSVGKAVSSSSKRPVNSNVTDRQRSTDQHYPDSAHFSSHIVQNLSSNDNENTSVIQLTSTEINDESPTAESLKAHSELIDLTCSDDDGDNDDHQQIDSDLSVGVENPESHRTLQSQPLSQQHPSCGQSKILRSSCASSSSSSRPSCMVAAGRSSTFAQQEIQHRPHGSQYCLRQSSFEEAPHLSTDMDPLSSNHLPISAGLNRETIGVLNVTQAPPPPPCHQPDCPHAMCTCHAHCPFCSVNTTLNVAPPPTVQGAPHYFVGCDLHSPCPGQCYHATHMQTMPAIVDPVAAPPPPNVTLTSVPSCRNSTSMFLMRRQCSWACANENSRSAKNNQHELRQISGYAGRYDGLLEITIDFIR
uniref:Uncharacterized protein n=1 Tax=Romanomermis culicivorax TaxID=13658 RepID=A0A915KJ78_ROMCU